MKSPSLMMPFGAALLGIALFAGMDALMKGLAMAIGSYNASLWRSLVGATILGCYFFGRGGKWPERAVMKLHIIRGIQVTFMLLLYFWGLARVPLAEGIALTFIAPLIALYLAAVQLKEAITPRAIWSSLIGLAGVGVIAYGRMTLQATPDVMWGIAAILVAAVCYAHNLILQRQQAQVASPSDIAFFNTLFVLFLLGLAAPWMAKLPPLNLLPIIIFAAAIASISIMLLAYAYARVETKVLLVTEYSAFIWGALLGWLFFHDRITWATIGGTALIVAGCVASAWKEPVRQPSAELGL